jgi:hypothetical protein
MGFGLGWLAVSAALAAAPTVDTQAPTELLGTVVKQDKRQLYLQHQGHIVALELKSSTRIDGKRVAQATPLQEGEQVRASFTLDKTSNIASRVERKGEAPVTDPAPANEKLIPVPHPSPVPNDPMDTTGDSSLIPDVGGTRGPASPMTEPR